MTHRQRLRRVAILCCHCLRNLAFYKAGWRKGVPNFEGQFWTGANGNFLDICVLEWCKLFGDERGKQYWRKVISDPEAFLQGQLDKAGVTEIEFNDHIQEMRTYRDKFVAHLDSEEVMHIPKLTITLQSVSYLYDYLLANEGEPSFFVDATKSASVFYSRFLKEGKEAYEARKSKITTRWAESFRDKTGEIIMVGDSEKQDFYSSIKQHGFHENDFELTQQRGATSGTGIYAITGTVTVRCKPNGKEKTYKAGHGSSWPSQFHDDLARGLFGKASA